MAPSRSVCPLTVLPLVMLVNLGILIGGDATVRYACAYVLLFVLPGAGLMRLLSGPHDDLNWLEKGIVGLAASYPVVIAVTLLAGYVPGKLTLPLELTFTTVCVLFIWLLAWWREVKSPPTPRSPQPVPVHSGVILGLIVLIACLLVLSNLGTSEFQGDEVMALLTGGSTMQGNDEAIFFHRKGPAEIVLPGALWVLSGTVTEWSARLPFALAGILAVIACYILARRAFGEWAALAAAALLALNGYLVGFSRIVQYQSVVLLVTVLAILCFYLSSRRDMPRYQILGAAFVAAGLLAHYDGIFVIPPVVFLYLTTGGRSWWRRNWRAILLAVLVGGGLAALFYVPFLQPSYLAQTSDYLAFRSGGKPFYNNLPLWFWSSTTYNSTYYVVFLVLAAVAAVAGRLRACPLALRFALGVAAIGIGCGTAFPEMWATGDHQLTFVPFCVAIGLAYLALRPSAVTATAPDIDPNGPRLALVWFAVPFLVYDFFLVERPGTHFWTMFPGLILLSAFGLDTVRRWLGSLRTRRSIRIATGAVFALGMTVLFGYYLFIVFVRVYPEYRAVYPDAKSPLYWTAYDELPERDYFGFPHRAGWKTIGVLYAQGILAGEYDSNEGGEITAWYVPDAPRHYCNHSPRYYFWAESAQDPGREIDPARLRDEFAETGVVTVEGRPGIRIFERDASSQAIAEYAVEQYAPDFDAARHPWDQWSVMGQFVSTPRLANFGDIIDLIGYDLDTSRSCPGGQLLLTLYWQRHGPPIQESYKVFSHLESDRLWAQADDVPGCSAWPTTNWKAGEIVADRHVIVLPDDISVGTHALSIGVYEPNRGTRLDVVDDAGNRQGNSLNLTGVSISPCAAPAESAQ